jgi:hypothetical protein
MSATAWGAVLNALYARVLARAEYRSAWDTTHAADNRIVFYTTEASLVADRLGTFLILAYPGDPSLPVQGGQTGQVVATLPTPRTRQELGIIRCMAIDQRGDVGPGIAAASLAAALSVLDHVDAELRAAPTLGLVPTFASLDVRVGGLPSIRPTVSAGTVTAVEFDVEFSARI